jgi:hypothetical protein
MMTHNSLIKDSDDNDADFNEDICSVHAHFVKVMVGLSGDLKWMIRIGKYFLCMIGSVIIIMVPIGVSLLVNLSSLNTRLDVTLSRLATLEKTVEKIQYVNDEQEKDFKRLRDTMIKLHGGMPIP